MDERHTVRNDSVRSSRRRKAPPGAKVNFPSFASKAEDLDALKKSVEDAAAVSGGLWLSYLFVMFYTAVSAGAVTHQDLLLESPVKLPFLVNIELPLKAFFVLAPIIFLVSHAYTLAHFDMLAKKARRFHDALFAQLPGNLPDSPQPVALREGLRAQLPSNIFVQFLAGPNEIRESQFGFLLELIAWTTLVFGPLSMLLLLQMQFLPYQEYWITWVHRVSLAIDFGLLWWLWRGILASRGVPRRSWTRLLARGSCIFGTLALIYFSWIVSMTPWELDSLEKRQLGFIAKLHSQAVHVHFFNTSVDGEEHPIGWFADTLVVRRLSLPQVLKIDPNKVDGPDYIFSLRYRNLNNADFTESDLRRVDFEHAKIGSAIFSLAKLEGAKFAGAEGNKTTFRNSAYADFLMEPTRFDGAILSAASFAAAKLEGANFESANLIGADFHGSITELAQANFYSAKLHGASFKGASLRGASLEMAELQGADLENAKLQGASLEHAGLQGASLNGAWLVGSKLAGANLQGATLEDAHLQAASLEGARLQGAWLYRAWLHAASLSGAHLQGACLREARLSATDFSKAYVWRTVFPTRLGGLFQGTGLEWSPKIGVDELNDVTNWTPELYEGLKLSIRALVPPGANRRRALDRIDIIDCSRPEPASCNPSAPITPIIVDVQQRIRAVSANKSYESELSKALTALICSGNQAPAITGMIENGRIAALGAQASAFLAGITGPHCQAKFSSDDLQRLRSHVQLVIEAASPEKSAPEKVEPASTVWPVTGLRSITTGRPPPTRRAIPDRP